VKLSATIAEGRLRHCGVESLEPRRLFSSYAYSFQSIAQFDAATTGANPTTLIADSGGDLFGTARQGAFGMGVVFEIPAGSGAITPLFAFNGTDGKNCGSLLLDSQGNLYGAAQLNATNDEIFELPAGSNAITMLATNLSVGSISSLRMDGAGNLYGASSVGGANGLGDVFEVVKGSGVATTLVTFNGANGSYPGSLLIDSSGDLYGAAELSGGSGNDEVFEIVAGSGALTTLAANLTGAGKISLAIDGNGDVFGAATTGGAGADGTVFEIPKGSASATTLATFDNTNGRSPGGLLVDSSGNLFGAAGFGALGSGSDEIFEIARGSGTATTLASSQLTGFGFISLVADANDNLFAAAQIGGDSAGDGSVFELARDLTPPTAAISAPNVTSAGGTSETIEVIYSDSIAVDASTINSGNISVTGPNGPLTVTGVTLSPDVDAGTITATYTVAAPGGMWTGADDGAYTINMLPGKVADTGGNTVLAKQTMFTVNVATTTPVATIAAANIVSASDVSETITVVYTDAGAAIDPTTIAATNLTVVGPAGSLAVMLAGTPGVSGNNVTATYIAAAPAGGWSPADDGSYTVSVLAGSVLDALKHSVSLTTAVFAVNLGADVTPPTAAISAPNVNAPGGASETVTVIYTDNVAVAASTIGIPNLSVVGPAGSLEIAAVNPSSATNAGTITVAYTFAAPGGAWTAGDNGTYTVKLAAGMIADTSGNTAAATQTTFSVNIGGTGPVATISAPDVISAVSTVAITVVYTDATSAIDVSTIAAANLTVTAPDTSTLAIALTGTTGTGNSVTATYSVGPAGAPFSAANDGSYTVMVLTGSVRDQAGAGVAATTGVFSVNLSANSTPPTASISAPVVTAPTVSETITVDYTDPSTAIDQTTIAGDNLAIISPEGTALSAIVAGISGSGNAITATYTVAPPNGMWQSSDDGIYTVAVRAASVKDVAGNAIAAAAGSFTVNLSADGNFNGGASVAIPFVAEQSLVLPGGQILLVGYQGVGTESQGAVQELNADGSVDTSFNSGAVVFSALSDVAFYSAAVQSDGKIVVAGTFGGSFLVGRYNADGSLDTDFGDNGFTFADFATGDAVANTVAIDSDGAIVLGGGAGGKFALALFESDGQADPTLNPGGTIDPSFPSGGRETIASTDGSISQIVLDDQDRIVAVGANGTNVTVIRLNPDGSPDLTFGSGGMMTAPGLASQDSAGNPVPTGVAIGTVGSILVTADSSSVGIAVDRLLPDGSLDPTFGAGGTEVVTFGGGSSDHAGVVSVDPTTGDFVLIGTTVLDGANQTVVAAFGVDGTPDANFGDNGTVAIAAGSAGAGTDSLSTPAGPGQSVQAEVIGPFDIHGTSQGVFGGLDPMRRIVVGSRATSGSTVVVLQPFATMVTQVGQTGKKPLVFRVGNVSVKLSATGGVVAVDQNGGQFDLTLTPTHAGAAMAVMLNATNGGITLGDVTGTQGVRLASFNAPSATLAGMMSMGGIIGVLKLGRVTGSVTAGGIGTLDANAIGGSISCTGAIGVAKINGAVTGTIEAGEIKGFFADSLSGATIIAGVNGPGSIASMLVGGAVIDSFVGAGVVATDGIFGDGDDTAAAGLSLIKSITVKGNISGTIFEAAKFPKIVHVPAPAKPANPPFLLLT
jgi:uncharacterized delta-60 repeat protein